MNIVGSLRHRDPTVQLSLEWKLLLVVLPWVLPFQTAVFGIAWWTTFREKRSARAWGIAASVGYLTMALFPLVFPPHSFFNPLSPVLALGIVGVLAFSWPAVTSDAMPRAPVSAISGDGTSSFLNQGLQLFAMLAYFGAYKWWIRWLERNDLSAPDFLAGTLMLIVVGLVIVTLHECGHALVGLILGMRLRAFLVGPLQWRIRDGKWELHFEPRQILVTSGATGVVPGARDFPRWRQLCMLVAGVTVNALTGCIALRFAYVEAARGTGDVLALFGAFSLVAAGMNLLPFRILGTYSDGAQIYQILSRGAWADFHAVVALAGASLVTSVRPRDYDIDAIHRAASAISQGTQGLLLQLLAHNYFLDRGELEKAGEELARAAKVYSDSAADAPVEFTTSFVFGSAYIWRSAEVARQWWAHVEAKKPRLNSDYWLTLSALEWVEGDLSIARESLEKAVALANSLPNAGAYEFERYRCSLLRTVLSEVAAAHS